jgi:adenylate cyclase
MGINTGYCTVGNFGSEARMDYTIIGGQVNIPNSIFISETTYTLVQDVVEVEGPRLIDVKGIHFPVDSSCANSTTSPARRARASGLRCWRT